MPACSVVIPLHDRRREIGRAVDSVLAQTFRDFELIVVDDGSKDGGAAEAERRGDRRLRVVAQAQAGAAAARNRGLREAACAWTAFLDSDDEWRPEFLEKTLSLARSRPGVVAVFSDILSAREGRASLEVPGAPRILDDYLAFASAHRGRGMTCSSTLVDRRALLVAGAFPEGVRRSEDIDAWLRLALAGAVGVVPDVLAVYHNEAWGPSRPPPEPCYPEVVRTLRRLRAEGAVPERLRRHFPRLEALYLLSYARDLIEYGQSGRARRVLLRELAWRHCGPVPLTKALVRSLQ